MEDQPYRVTFVCTGNICRSPVAEAVFRHQVALAGLGETVAVDSSGTGGWHAGDGADRRAVRSLRGRGDAGAHRARQFQADWFDRYDLILALDSSHLSALRRLAPDAEARDRIRLLREFDPATADTTVDLDVPDPYYGDETGFDHVLGLVEAACHGLLAHVREELAERG